MRWSSLEEDRECKAGGLFSDLGGFFLKKLCPVIPVWDPDIGG